MSLSGSSHYVHITLYSNWQFLRFFSFVKEQILMLQKETCHILSSAFVNRAQVIIVGEMRRDEPPLLQNKHGERMCMHSPLVLLCVVKTWGQRWAWGCLRKATGGQRLRFSTSPPWDPINFSQRYLWNFASVPASVSLQGYRGRDRRWSRHPWPGFLPGFFQY